VGTELLNVFAIVGFVASVVTLLALARPIARFVYERVTAPVKVWSLGQPDGKRPRQLRIYIRRLGRDPINVEEVGVGWGVLTIERGRFRRRRKTRDHRVPIGGYVSYGLNTAEVESASIDLYKLKGKVDDDVVDAVIGERLDFLNGPPGS
jgi:hypothetical protein